MQRNPDLESGRHTLAVTDADMIFHRWKANVDGLGTRRVQLAMWVEVKTFGAELTESQHETLFFHHQSLSTQGKTVSVKTLRGDVRAFWHFGVYVLRLPGAEPDETGCIWGVFNPDGTITWWESMAPHLKSLNELLRFDLRPDRPIERISLRRHHKTRRIERQVITGLGLQVSEIVVNRS